MINAKMYDFYGVALSSVEVALKLRAVGSIAPFFSARNREKIAAKLDEEMQEVLETYYDNIREMDAIAEKEAFAYGFRLGVKLAVAGLSDDGKS